MWFRERVHLLCQRKVTDWELSRSKEKQQLIFPGICFILFVELLIHHTDYLTHMILTDHVYYRLLMRNIQLVATVVEIAAPHCVLG